MTEIPSILRDRQRPLSKLYRQEPAAAWVTDVARTECRDLADPLHGSVVIGPAETSTLPVALHTAVGGESDAPVPGDILCAALASCLDTTMRAVADRLRVRIERLTVEATAEVDVRGTLRVDDGVPVAFQRMTLSIDLQLEAGAPRQARELLLAAAEHSCVVLQTLRAGVPVETTLSVTEPKEEVRHAC